jgi:hypothetical protein
LIRESREVEFVNVPRVGNAGFEGNFIRTVIPELHHLDGVTINVSPAKNPMQTLDVISFTVEVVDKVAYKPTFTSFQLKV